MLSRYLHVRTKCLRVVLILLCVSLRSSASLRLMFLRFFVPQRRREAQRSAEKHLLHLRRFFAEFTVAQDVSVAEHVTVAEHIAIAQDVTVTKHVAIAEYVAVTE